MKTSDDYRDEHRKLMRAYAGFQMAAALLVATKSESVCWAWIVVVLFSISIPSTIAYGGFARITPEDEKRNPQGVAFACGCLAFMPSIAAISILLASASIIAAVAFPIASAAWFITIVIIRKRNRIQTPIHEVK